MKKVFISILLVFSVLFVSAQGGFVGYLYSLKTGTKEAFRYSVSTKFDSRAFQTIYKLSKPGTDKVRYTITASHFKPDKKVVVEVNDEQYLLSSINGNEEVKYEVEALQPFGIRGNVGVLDKSAPNQLAVQFLSSRFEYVRVINFLGSYSNGIFQFFLLSKNDKINEPKDIIIHPQKGKLPHAKFRRPTQKDSISNSFFTGTRNFCDAEKSWKYEVTIKNDSITLKLFPGSANSHYTDEDKLMEVIKGIIVNGRITTKDSLEYLTNRFKYENGMLYEINNEGDYNEFKECEGFKTKSF